MEAGENNEERLREAIERLPGHQAPFTTWHQITKTLDSNERMGHAIDQLPTYQAPPGSWERLSGVLHEHKRAWWQSALVARIAASIILVLVAGLLWVPFRVSEKAETITYEEEIVVSERPGLPNASSSAIAEAVALAKQQCANGTYLCHAGEVRELLTQLDLLDEEMHGLEKAYSGLIGTPELAKAQLKIENLRAELAKNIIKLLIS